MPRTTESGRVVHALRTLCTALFALSSGSVLWLVVAGSYDLWLGPVHLAAHGLFKPLLEFNGLLLLLWAVAPAAAASLPPNGRTCSERTTFFVIVGIVVLLYGPSMGINVVYPDWTHRDISASIRSMRDVVHLFYERQADGFYRPLTYISLLTDYRLFHGTLWAYHLQSIGLHILNAWLLVRLAAALGFGAPAARWAGWLYAAAAVNFEVLLWPAARFDLLATAFTLAALLFALRYLRSPGRWHPSLAATTALYLLGLCNKESAYCFPLILGALVATGRWWRIGAVSKPKLLALGGCVAAVTVGMVALRIAVYGNLGGYPRSIAPQSPHFTLTARTFPVLVERIFPVPLFGVNSSAGLTGWLKVATLLFVLGALLAYARSREGVLPAERRLLLFAFLGGLPVLNIVGWIGPSMQQARYVYLPSIWIFLMVAAILQRHRQSWILTVLLLANVLGVESNLSVYRRMLGEAQQMAAAVGKDCRSRGNIQEVDIAGMPSAPYGVAFFDSELIADLQRSVPAARVVRWDSIQADSRPGQRVYRWDSSHRWGALVAVR